MSSRARPAPSQASTASSTAVAPSDSASPAANPGDT